MKNTNSLLKLAKSGTKKPIASKSKVISKEEEIDSKAKQKVNELLQNSEFVSKKDDLLELESEKGSVKWLEEQVDLFSKEREKLREELAQSKEDYIKLFTDYQRLKNNLNTDDNVTGDSELKKKITDLFNELQFHHMTMGVNPRTGRPNLDIQPIAFLNRLIMFFPFLNSEKKFRE